MSFIFKLRLIGGSFVSDNIDDLLVIKLSFWSKIVNDVFFSIFSFVLRIRLSLLFSSKEILVSFILGVKSGVFAFIYYLESISL